MLHDANRVSRLCLQQLFILCSLTERWSDCRDDDGASRLLPAAVMEAAEEPELHSWAAAWRHVYCDGALIKKADTVK